MVGLHQSTEEIGPTHLLELHRFGLGKPSTTSSTSLATLTTLQLIQPKQFRELDSPNKINRDQ